MVLVVDGVVEVIFVVVPTNEVVLEPALGAGGGVATDPDQVAVLVATGTLPEPES